MLMNNILSGTMALFRPAKVICSPVHVQIEHTTYCNLTCPQCPRQEYLKSPQHMEFGRFKEVVDKLKPSAVTLNGLGESFMNPDTVEMIRYVKSCGININTTSNFTVFTEPLADKVVESGLDLLNISVDAATEGTYQIVRRSEAFGKVIENIKRMVAARKRMNRKLPVLRLCFVVQESNMEEMVQFYTLAGEIGADAVFYQTFAFNGQSEGQTIAQNSDIGLMHSNLKKIMELEKLQKTPVSNALHLSRKIDIIKDHYKNMKGEGYRDCMMPWISLYVSVEGDIRPCYSFSGTRFNMGNIFDDTALMETFNSEGCQKFRIALRNGNPPHSICNQCLPESFIDLFRKKLMREVV